MKLGPLQKNTWVENCLKELTAHRIVDGLDETKSRARNKERYRTFYKIPIAPLNLGKMRHKSSESKNAQYNLLEASNQKSL